MPEPIKPPAPGSGVRYKDGEIVASDESFGAFLRTVEHVTDRVLDWSATHPVQFFGVLVFLAFAVWVWSRTWLERTKMKQEYEDRRLPPRRENPPALPTPAQPKVLEPEK